MARELSLGTHGMASVKPNDEDMSALAKIKHFHHGWNRIFVQVVPATRLPRRYFRFPCTPKRFLSCFRGALLGMNILPETVVVHPRIERE